MENTIKTKPISPGQIEAIAKVLGQTDTGLTGSEIGQILSISCINDPSPGLTKWRRLDHALSLANNPKDIFIFIQNAMDPARYVSNQSDFHIRRVRLNRALSLHGSFLGEDGKLMSGSKTNTLKEVNRKFKRFREQLELRNAHPEVLRFCGDEVLSENYFHAVLESSKSITSKIRKLSNSSEDGSTLVEFAFSKGRKNYPRVAINSYQTKTEIGEQNGFVNLLTGFYGMIRNPHGHEPKIEWGSNEQDALDTLSMVSLIHRKLDKAVGTGV